MFSISCYRLGLDCTTDGKSLQLTFLRCFIRLQQDEEDGDSRDGKPRLLWAV
jgi:hypothetical protein